MKSTSSRYAKPRQLAEAMAEIAALRAAIVKAERRAISASTGKKPPDAHRSNGRVIVSRKLGY
jgi:hypothetical protein